MIYWKSVMCWREGDLDYTSKTQNNRNIRPGLKPWPFPRIIRLLCNLTFCVLSQIWAWTTITRGKKKVSAVTNVTHASSFSTCTSNIEHLAQGGLDLTLVCLNPVSGGSMPRLCLTERGAFRSTCSSQTWESNLLEMRWLSCSKLRSTQPA